MQQTYFVGEEMGIMTREGRVQYWKSTQQNGEEAIFSVLARGKYLVPWYQVPGSTPSEMQDED